MAEEKVGGYTNFATHTAANILAHYSTHFEAVGQIVDRIMQWDDEEEVVIPKIMTAIRDYFTEIADWNLSQTYQMPGASKAEASDMRHAVGDMFNAAMGCVNWREVAKHQLDVWRER